MHMPNRDERHALNDAKIEDLSALLEQASIGIHLVDGNGKVVWANNTELDMMGYTSEEYLGHHISEFHAEPDVINDILQRLSSNETLKNYPAKLISRNGETKYVSINSNVYRENGEIVHTRCFTQDVTEKVLAERERQKLEEKLLQAQKLESLGTLAGGVAHDFNNLLTPILGITQHVQKQLDNTSKEHESLEIVLRSALKAKELVNQILMACQKKELNLGVVYLDEIIRDVTTFLKATMPANIELIYEPDATTVTIKGDGTQIYQVIVNLCINSYQSMPSGGSIVIKLKTPQEHDVIDLKGESKKGTFVCLTVTDTGCGMDA